MNLRSQLAAVKDQRLGLSRVEGAQLCCRLAKQLEKAGEYEAACEALEEFWPDRDGKPGTEGLDDETKAEVLLRVGALSGWLGSARQTLGGQESAKNLITQSVEILEGLGSPERVAEALADLALCYWREGALDESRIHLDGALSRLQNQNDDLKAVILIRACMVEVRARRLNDALRFCDEAAPLVEKSNDEALKGAFHNGFGLVFRKLADADPREDYLDRALIEYAAASFHFEQAGHTRFQGCVDINLGFLFFTLGRFAQAHQYLDRARQSLLEIDDRVHLAQVNDTKARTLIAEGRLQEAQRFARSAVHTLKKGDEQALLAEALTTYGIVVARLGNHLRSKALLEEAIRVAETAGDLEGSGRAELSIIEELTEQTSATELVSIYESALDLLQQSQDPSAAKRLISCARKVIDTLVAVERERNSEAIEPSWEGFSFKKEVLRVEEELIERGLRASAGSVTRAARLLGFGHHQSLITLINSRHRELLKTRSTVRKRRHHIFSKSRKIKRKVIRQSPDQASSHISILHVEDDQQIAKLVDEMLATEECNVELCTDGYGALEKLTGNGQYDVLVVDNEIPGLSGLELVQRARNITQRRRTPIIMLSGSDCETEAWGAGVDEFLKKPEQIGQLPSTIDRLLRERRERRD
jgi:CheY-like chemotaxis protein/tetratricopeptide (TPR) repeat protein